jgi:hypothetical protein
VLGTTHLSDPAAMFFGWCLYDLGRPAEAAAALDRELSDIPADAMRTNARFGVRRALAYAVGGEIEHACHLTSELLRSVDVVDSATISTDLRRLNRVLARFHRNAAVRELSPRLTASLRIGA